jgi:nucleotide-binding universal stress UspA family protein
MSTTEATQENAVVGVEFDDSGDDAIMEALRWMHGTPHRVLHAVHVLDPSSVKDTPVKPALVAKEEALARIPQVLANWIQQIATKHKLACERLQTHVRIGKAAETVLQVAIDYDADLIIVGTHGRRGLDRFLLGSVAEKLVRGAHCPVLIARPKDYRGAEKTKLPDQPYPPGQEPHYTKPHDVPQHIQTESDIWQPSGARPTGFRIV